MFQENLKKIVESTEGGVSALLMGFDGIAVDNYSVPESGSDIQNIGMEFSFIFTQVKKAAESLELGDTQEVTIRTDKLTVLIRMLTKEYFLALAIRPEGNFGKGRFLLRTVGPKMSVEL